MVEWLRTQQWAGGTGRPYIKVVTFNGMHNAIKARLLTFLYLQSNAGNQTGFTHKQMILLVPGLTPGYGTRYVLLWRWGYINRKAGKRKGRGGNAEFRYTIAPRGTRFVEQRLPPAYFQQITEELKAAYRNYVESLS